MPKDSCNPSRKSPIHLPAEELFNRPIIVFVTVCSKDRKPFLANELALNCLLKAWNKADLWQIGRYVILPDHLHLFCSPAVLDHPPLIKWISYWKSLAANSWPFPDQSPIWQRHFWDTQLRRSDSYDEKWEYVRSNPVRHGLIQNADDWRWQGELADLRWYG